MQEEPAALEADRLALSIYSDSIWRERWRCPDCGGKPEDDHDDPIADSWTLGADWRPRHRCPDQGGVLIAFFLVPGVLAGSWVRRWLAARRLRRARCAVQRIRDKHSWFPSARR